MNVETILAAMRADCIPARDSARWAVEKIVTTEREGLIMAADGNHPPLPAGSYTLLCCYTMATIMQKRGELVMNDFPSELRKHLEFVLKARGRVLVTGLGLGCVVRGLLSHGVVESIDIIERCEDVIRLCGDSVKDPRVTIHHRDAVNGFLRGEWDYAWHDLWSDPERDEPHLHVIHAKLMAHLCRRVKHQGAWAMPRHYKRKFPSFVG